MKAYQVILTLLSANAMARVMHSVTSSANIQQATSIPDTAHHTADHAAQDNPGPKDDAHPVGKKCIHFTSDNPNWHFANTGVWGSHTDTFGGNRTICVPTTDDAGGAMFIGTGANPSAGNTKLECYFPKSGQANCDISLVDGYSLSVTCNASGKKIGGAVDLWKTGKPCVDTSAKSSGICKNDLGYAPQQSDVSPFFQAAINNGNKYCIWVNCAQDYYFPITADLSCHVSGTAVN